MLKNPQHERFAQRKAKLDDNGSAYEAAYPGTKRSVAASNGSRLLKKAEIQSRITELQRAGEDEALLTIREKREFYAAIVRTPIGEIDDNHPLCQAVKRIEATEKGGGSVEYRMPDKLKATQLDNELSGHVKQVGTTVNVGVAVNNITVSEQERTELMARKRQSAERARLAQG